MQEEEDFVRITLRIPKALHSDLMESAAKKRSMNAEIIARLEDSFRYDGKEQMWDDRIEKLQKGFEEQRIMIEKLLKDRS